MNEPYAVPTITTSHQYFIPVRLRCRFFWVLVRIGLLHLHVLREDAYSAFEFARALLYFRMTTRKTDALARETILFFLHRPEFANGCFRTGFWRQSYSRIQSDEFDSGKKPRAIEFMRKSAYREQKKITADGTRNRQTLSKSPCQLSRVLSTLSGVLRFREILESWYRPVEQKCARVRGLRVSNTINCLVVR